jgi:hypothetical protein
MTTAVNLTDLLDEIRAKFVGLRGEVTSFDSGAAMLDVWWRDRFWVLEYSPRDGYVLDNESEKHPFNSGFSFATQDFEAARQWLLNSLEATDARDEKNGTADR